MMHFHFCVTLLSHKACNCSSYTANWTKCYTQYAESQSCSTRKERTKQV